tara:strand:- start:34 stop:294 length:261 start_codon:yes stop_codon:yes gene_type:complete
MKIESEKKPVNLDDVIQSVFDNFCTNGLNQPIVLYNCGDLGNEFRSALGEKFEVNNYGVSISFGDSNAEGYCIDVSNLISCYGFNK